MLPIREAIIFEGERHTLEDPQDIDEVQPVVLQVQVAFRFGPGELRELSVYTLRSCVKKVREKVQSALMKPLRSGLTGLARIYARGPVDRRVGAWAST